MMKKATTKLSVMEKIVIFFLLAIMSVGCSKDDENNQQTDSLPELMRRYDISASDTNGLKIFGAGLVLGNNIVDNDTIVKAILGNKNGYLWVQFMKAVKYVPEEGEPMIKIDLFNKIASYMSSEKLNDVRINNLGYGKVDTVRAKYIGWHDYESLDYYNIAFHDYNHFAISKYNHDDTRLEKDRISWIINDKELINSNAIFEDVLYTGYWGIGMEENMGKVEMVYDNKGSFLYISPDYISIKKTCFVNMYEYIRVSNTEIARVEIQTEKPVWKYKVDKLGHTIDGHEPKVEYTLSTTNNAILVEYKITNYDGTYEEELIKLNIETGNKI